jgi:pyruvate dehydrogenase E2 component (dihydrolipoamide acetyltransferase)
VTDVLMPALSPTMEEGTLAKWFIKPGDTVRSGDVIAEIETDKATMEVEAVDEGEVAELLVPEGAEEVKVNTPIARLKGEGEPTPAPALAKAQSEPLSPRPSPPEGQGGPRSGSDEGSLRTVGLAGDKQISEQSATPHPSAEPALGPAAGRTRGPPPSPARGEGTRVFASPLARRLAREARVDLASIRGSGPHGRIIRRDVEGLVGRQAPAAAPAPGTAQRQVLSLEQIGVPPGSYDLVPLDGMKKTIARRMTESFRDVPHFPLTIDLEIDRLLGARTRINALLEGEGVKVSVNDLVIKAAALALKRVPAANASYTPDGIAMHHHADVAIAVAVEGGLITPIVRAAETKGLAEIARESKDLAERARTRKLKLEEYQGGTFTVSNLGMFGIKSFASIINEPQGAILSVGAGEKRPVVRNDQLVIATVMSVTLTCDHRVVDGAIGARFLAAFKAMIEEPVTMIV